MSSSNASQPALSPEKQALLDLQHVQRVDEAIFLGIQIAGGHILLPLLVLTIIFSRKVTRHPVFVNFCVSWIFSSVIYSMLVYRGRSSNDILSLNPTYDACLIQASLLNGVQTLTTCTTLGLVVHLWVVLRSYTKSRDLNFLEGEKWGLAYTCSLVILPFAIFLAFTIGTMVIGSPLAIDATTDQPITDSNLSIPGVFYCVILQNANFTHSLTSGLGLLRAVYVFSAVISFTTVCFEVLVARLVYKQRALLKKIASGWLTLFLRVALFSAYRILVLSLNLTVILLTVILHPNEILFLGIAKHNLLNRIIDYVQAAIPLVAFLLFATEKDVLSVWYFWRKDKGTVQTKQKNPMFDEEVNAKNEMQC